MDIPEYMRIPFKIILQEIIYKYKLNNIEEKVMGLHTCFHSPEVNCVGWYPALASLFFSRPWAIFPAFGSPYIPFTILM